MDAGAIIAGLRAQAKIIIITGINLGEAVGSQKLGARRVIVITPAHNAIGHRRRIIYLSAGSVGRQRGVW